MNSQPASSVRQERDGSVLTLFLDRPDKLNALSKRLLGELLTLLRQLEADVDTRPRALVIAGSGEKAFAAGADIAELASMNSREALALSELGMEAFDQMERCSFPCIAAVQGFALGGGCELALAADFIIAADNAVFGLPEVKLGLMPGFGGTQRLARRVGSARARQLVYTGGNLKAKEALELGLVNEVVPKAELLSRARTVAKRIARNAPLAVSSAKRCMQSGLETNLRAACDLESRSFAGLFDSRDARHGLEGFLQKRGEPDFEGR